MIRRGLAEQVREQIGFAVKHRKLLTQPRFVPFLTPPRTFLADYIKCKMKYLHRHSQSSRKLSGTTTLRAPQSRSVEFSGLVVPENWRELLLWLRTNSVFLFITLPEKVFCGAFFQKSDLSRNSFSPTNINLQKRTGSEAEPVACVL